MQALPSPSKATLVFVLVVISTFGGRMLAQDSKPPAAASPMQSARRAPAWHGQHFVCNTGYTIATCHEQTEMLVKVLARFCAAMPDDWTWVLIRQDDWRPVVTRIGLDPHSPAFSALGRRETFLDETLFVPNPVNALDLIHTYALPLSGMLELAVSHELGHAFCMEKREAEADRFGEELRKNGIAQCSSPTRPASRDTMITLPAPR